MEKSTSSNVMGINVEEGYELLAKVLTGALDQSQGGKGKERHATNNAFEEQPICTEIRELGLASAAYQVRKKCREAMRLLEIKGKDAAINELRGSIVYAAAMIVAIELGYVKEGDNVVS